MLVLALVTVRFASVCAEMDGAQIRYIALAKFPSLYEQGHGGELRLVGVTAAILGVADSTNYFLRFLTLDVFAGRQLGGDAFMGIPQVVGSPADPWRIAYSNFVYPGEVIVLGADLQLAAVSVTLGADNTPVPGALRLIGPIGNPATLGAGRAIAEITGAAFADRKPRLFVGTDTGKILVLLRDDDGNLSLDKIVTVNSGLPISDLGALPQLGEIDLGVSSGSTLYGLRTYDGSYRIEFQAETRDRWPVYSFKVLNRSDAAISSSLGRVSLAYSDGYKALIHFASLAPDAAGTLKMDTAYAASGLTSEYARDPSMIYILNTRESSVLFRPGYPDGSSVEGCTINITDSVPDECTACPIWMTGDVDQTGTITSTDLIRLVKYVFQGGTPPKPCAAAGDVDCSGKVDATDVIRLIRYALMNGPPPCNVCTLFNGTWTCP